MTPFRTICITLRDASYISRSGGPRDHSRMREHFAARGISPTYFYAVNVEPVGIRTIHPYEYDNPGSGYMMLPAQVGCWLAHRFLWSALLLLPDDVFLVIEDDAEFHADWRERTARAIADCPPDWDMLLIGNCDCAPKPKTHVAGEVWDVRWPATTHAYLVRRKALEALIDTTDAARCYAPIDLSLGFHSYAALKVYTLLPRAVDQFDTVLIP